ncbi:MAG: tetratricopeptide repeat protein [Bryobacterales bacterium]|nr:tetratricopeptide repeat protein [Bryobacterales bacterium]
MIPRSQTPGAYRKAFLLVLSFSFVLSLAASSISCGGSARTPLPELPPGVLDGILPSVRVEIEKAYKNARSHPNDAAANGRLGMVFHAHKVFESADPWYERAHQLAPRVHEWAYYLAIVQQVLGKNEEATATFREAIRLKPEYWQARLKLADHLLSRNEVGDSLALYEELLKQPYPPADAYFGQGRILSTRGETQAAIQAFERACELAPNFGAAHYAVALAYRDSGDKERSELHMKRYTRDPSGIQAFADPLMVAVNRLNAGAFVHVRRAEDLVAAGRLKDATKEMEEALRLDPTAEAAHANLIELYWKTGDWDKAEEHYKQVIRINPDSARSHFNYGMLMLQMSRYKAAAAAFDLTLEINPNDFRALTQSGRALEGADQMAAAEKRYRKALGINARSRDTNYLLGVLLMKTKRAQEGLQHLKETLEPEDEKTPSYLAEIASAYAKSGNRGEAKSHYEKAIRMATAANLTKLVPQLQKELMEMESKVR